MSAMQMQFHPTPDEDTAAAIVAAIACHLEAIAGAEQDLLSRSAWRSAALLSGQGLPPAPGGSAPTWSSADRSGRAVRWSSGIVGM